MLGWAFKNEGSNDIRSMAIPKAQASKVNTMFRWVELSKSITKMHNVLGCFFINTQHMQCFAGLGLRKHDSATFIFPSKSQKTVHANLCCDGPPHT